MIIFELSFEFWVICVTCIYHIIRFLLWDILFVLLCVSSKGLDEEELKAKQGRSFGKFMFQSWWKLFWSKGTSYFDICEGYHTLLDSTTQYKGTSLVLGGGSSLFSLPWIISYFSSSFYLFFIVLQRPPMGD